MSAFAMPRGAKEPAAGAGAAEDEGPPMPDFDDGRVMRAMSEMERDMAHMMRKMKDILPAGTIPKELDVAIKRLESGEDPEKIEEDMGDVLGDFMGGPEDEEGGMGGYGGGAGYSRDSGLYDY